MRWESEWGREGEGRGGEGGGRAQMGGRGVRRSRWRHDAAEIQTRQREAAA